ncbi:radical SAM/SPASM family putative metalloenzyme maturase [Geoalkalibacter halelectricus]|uniref:radical SAM/SPASM family putative metalloenzyme maturase n=1 Tax=Geoalkalibacter halelectricus TaxID=2847045 RepID=UPI003D1D9215
MTLNDSCAQQRPAVENHPALAQFPAKLFVEVTTRCNMECFMCMKQTPESGICEGDLNEATFAALKPAFAHLDALILNGVGEPLLHPRLEEMIAAAKAEMKPSAWVGFQSNGLLLTEQRAQSLVDAGLDRICLSVDAASPELFRKVREGGDIHAVDRALTALENAKRNRPESRLEIGMEFVAMRDNLGELPRAIRWAAERGASFALITHMLPYDEEHAVQAAYPTVTAEALQLFHKWRDIARDQGLDIRRYFKSLIRYATTRSEDEKRLYRLVEQMKAEALAQGVVVDLRSLMAVDEGLLDEVARVFAESRLVAEECGVDLRLPEILPKHQRSCEFVEEGGAFVAWDGKVYPCYFLWHRFNCYAMGWEQKVQPKVFGDLAATPLLDIWNAPAFREFRAKVIRYDYPFCSNCAVAPCDLVQAENFEHDCHAQSEPCGSCLWCMGLFQCLR